MNKWRVLLALVAALWIAGRAEAQNSSNRIVVPLSDPSRPATVKVALVSGSITVIGYSGKEILVVPMGGDESDDMQTPRTPKPPQPPQPPQGHKTPRPDNDSDEDEEVGTEGRAKGLRKLPNWSSGLSIYEDHNEVTINSDSWNQSVDIKLQVPVGTSLDLNTVNDGDIVVRNVDGELNVENTNGEVHLKDVSGSVVAHALNGDVEVTLQRLDPNRGMSFTSMNGDIDVTLPASTKADIRIKSDNGEVYTDFDLQLGAQVQSKSDEETEAFKDKDKSKSTKHRSRREYGYQSAMVGKLNGGGPRLIFETFNGNIYIRKAK
jgi:hypothetical protein